MRRRVAVVCRPEVAPGFRLAGLAPSEALGPAEAAGILESLRRDGRTGVVLVQQRLYDGLAEEVRAALEREAVPLAVPFPEPTWAAEEGPEAYVVRLLRRAIGYRVRLR